MKPRLPKGMRDFTPEQVKKRNYIFDTLKSVFTKYGYRPIETPTMENLSTLTGKYGEEGDKLLFKVLNSGDFLRKAKDLDDYKKLGAQICEKGLRYDLTIPFARYVVMNQNDIAFPFKRYQIQAVWRADRPQRGRYREFYQCDVDVVGSRSLINEAELVQIYDEAFTHFQLPVTIRISSRKILTGIAEVAGIPEQLTAMTIAIDKLDKVGLEGVVKELANRDINDTAIEKIKTILQIETLEALEVLLKDSTIGQSGIQEVQTVFDYINKTNLQNTLKFDVTLARGLDYYTGCIFEVNAEGVNMGSIGGGGRYDDLTSIFGLKDMSGVGVSFGAERIYDVMEELNLFPESLADNTDLLIIVLDEENLAYGFDCLQTIRGKGIQAEIYPDAVKLKKVMKFANTRGFKRVAIIGSNEAEHKQLTLKDMETGEQKTLSVEVI